MTDLEISKALALAIGSTRNHWQVKHGMAGTRQYKIWAAMRQRCSNPKEESYAVYGGRGIKVCAEWATFIGFWSDMADGYAPNLTIDRIDNDGDYCKDNCRWATKTQQARNTSKNRKVVYQGTEMSVAEAAEKAGLNRFALRQRVADGVEGEALFAPRLQSGRKKAGEKQRPIADTPQKAIALAVIERAKR
jgi:hypothetical protein